MVLPPPSQEQSLHNTLIGAVGAFVALVIVLLLFTLVISYFTRPQQELLRKPSGKGEHQPIKVLTTDEIQTIYDRMKASTGKAQAMSTQEISKLVSPKVEINTLLSRKEETKKINGDLQKPPGSQPTLSQEQIKALLYSVKNTSQ